MDLNSINTHKKEYLTTKIIDMLKHLHIPKIKNVTTIINQLHAIENKELTDMFTAFNSELFETHEKRKGKGKRIDRKRGHKKWVVKKKY